MTFSFTGSVSILIIDSRSGNNILYCYVSVGPFKNVLPSYLCGVSDS